MPVFVVNTNVPCAFVPDGLLPELSQQLAQATGSKPSQYIAVHMFPDQLMAFGDSSNPWAFGSLNSIGKIGGTQNQIYTKLLRGLLSQRLHISPDRVYINYYDRNAANVGWNNSTFSLGPHLPVLGCSGPALQVPTQSTSVSGEINGWQQWGKWAPAGHQHKRGRAAAERPCGGVGGVPPTAARAEGAVPPRRPPTLGGRTPRWPPA
ncbi:PREDICTED: macrophage migration inhibitory factor-like [Elephantulus edwardii]|uniref:macrophage migration inhibitory factor-like n=1 Tax=Elephantulus edwardii TaxID=28737 RepID=UPI0003F07D4B|nr:PREDICTED: macrophage migration inhibitory factor-like [Elephantulus edwardii]